MGTKKIRVKPGQNQQNAEQRRRLFIEAYLSNGGNATQAALDAGFSPNSAASQGSRLLKNVKVSQELDNRRAKVLSDAGITTDRVLRNLAQALYFDPRKLFRDDGSLKDVSELDDDTAMALSSFEVFEEFGNGQPDEELEPQAHGGGLKRKRGRRELIGFTKKVKWLDKNTARDQAMKHLGEYLKDNKQTGEATANALTMLLQGMQRSALPIVPDPKP